MPWYAANRDLPKPPFGTLGLYESFDELRSRFKEAISEADLVIVGSYVPDGVEVGRWAQQQARGICAFYDIDTPVTLAKLERGDEEYLTAEMIGDYDLYLSFTGGPTLTLLEERYGAPMARALYCSADLENYRPLELRPRWELGYLGTHSDDRQPRVEALLNEPARRLKERSFIVAGAGYPQTLRWPANVDRVEHLPPAEHAAFYNSQRFTLNITRDDMIAAGHSPSIRLFEAAACGAAIITDRWEGIDALFEPFEEILIADDSADIHHYLCDLGENDRRRIGAAARARVLAGHTAAHRAQELVSYFEECQSA